MTWRALFENPHDYQIEWDYQKDNKPPKAVVLLSHPVLKELRRAARPLRLKSLRLFFVQQLDSDHLARYVNGTSSAPVFVLDARALVQAAKRYDVDLETALRSTLFHELGHAYLDSVGIEMEEEQEEALVERYARAMTYSEIPPEEGPGFLQRGSR